MGTQPPPHRKGHSSPHFLTHVYCGQTVAHFSNCRALVFGRPFVKRFALCYWTVVCPVLSVTLVYCGQTVGRIKIKLGMRVSLGSGHIVLNRGYMCSLLHAIIACNLLHAINCTCNHDFRWGPRCSSPKGHSPPIFGPYLLWPNG